MTIKRIIIPITIPIRSASGGEVFTVVIGPVVDVTEEFDDFEFGDNKGVGVLGRVEEFEDGSERGEV